MAGKINLDPKVWLNKIISFFKNFKNLPKDEKLAWISIFIGIIFIIIGIIL